MEGDGGEGPWARGQDSPGAKATAVSGLSSPRLAPLSTWAGPESQCQCRWLKPAFRGDTPRDFLGWHHEQGPWAILRCPPPPDSRKATGEGGSQEITLLSSAAFNKTGVWRWGWGGRRHLVMN